MWNRAPVDWLNRSAIYDKLVGHISIPERQAFFLLYLEAFTEEEAAAILDIDNKQRSPAFRATCATVCRSARNRRFDE
jgi:hypothetical protein